VKKSALSHVVKERLQMHLEKSALILVAVLAYTTAMLFILSIPRAIQLKNGLNPVALIQECHTPAVNVIAKTE
jgi:hypothetical protein